MSSDRPLDLDIAIVGIAGRFPGAASVEAFWQNLRAGVESIRDLSDEEICAAGVDEETLADPRFVRRAADLGNVDLFDAALFGFTPREAELMDPQFRVFLEDAWTALEDAGHFSDRRDLRVGVFAGASGNTYLSGNIATNPRAAEAVGEFFASLGNDRDYLATHVAYRLDLRGPSLVVQTACSTSLVAAHLACQSLIGRECDVALAGGVSIGVPQTTGYLWEEGSIVSPDGRCRAFDASAAGCVKGNGSGIVVLRRLEDALRDRDRIRAVIRGSAVNNDGAMKVGFTAPGEQGQAGVIAEALAASGVDPATIDYVEAHGTATALGDPVEIAALARAFGPAPARGAPCWLGSVKTNIGHLDAAAGVAGLIKTVLALEHREIPPSLHFERANPKIDFAATPFRVNAELRIWESGVGPRRAGVSSFGIGGTNAHVVLEEAPKPSHVEHVPPSRAREGQAQESHLIVLSAATESALASASEALAAKLDSSVLPSLAPMPTSEPAPSSASSLAPSLASSLADVAFTLQVGRRRLPWRRALVATDAAGAAAALREAAPGSAVGNGAAPRATRGRGLRGRDERRGTEVAFLFPGQGAQYTGMGLGLYRSEPVFREALDHCAEIVHPILGVDLREVAFAVGADRHAADERLRDTAIAQPALFALDWALVQLWHAWGVVPAVLAGHSLGEFVAAALAGVLSVEEAITLVAERGRLMGLLPRGAMLAVASGEADLLERLKSHPALALAAVNGPLACVASGPEGAIARLEAELEAAGLGHRRLRTSHAFHSAMMDPAVAPFQDRVSRVRLAAPSIPFVSNVTGTWISNEQATDPAYWAMHLRHTVRFADAIATLASEPDRIFLEVGPGTTLASLARAQAGPDSTIISSLGPSRPHRAGPRQDRGGLHEDHARRSEDPSSSFGDAAQREGEGAHDRVVLLEALGRLWCAGAEIDWQGVHSGSEPRRLPLPTYPFERRRYWIEPGPGNGRSDEVSPQTSGTKNPELADWFYIPGWKRSVLLNHDRPAGAASQAVPEPVWLVLDDGSPLGAAVAARAAARGARVIMVRPGTTYAQRGETAFEIDAANRGDWDRLVRDLEAAGPLPSRIAHLWCQDPQRLDPDRSQDLGFFALLFLLQAVWHAGGVQDLRLVAVANGLFDVLGEAPLVPDRATLVGLCRVAPQEDPHVTSRLVDVGGGGPDEGSRAIAVELDASDTERVAAWRGGHRWVPSYERVRLAPSPALGDAVQPGGAYALTGGAGPLELALAARLVQAGAKGIALLGCEGDVSPALALPRGSAAEVIVSNARASDPASLGAALDDVRRRFGRLDAVFHTAGTIGGGMIALKERAAAEGILAPRLRGARAILESLRDGEILVLFSAAVSATGVFGQVDFCAASAYLDALAQSRRRGTGPRVIALDWGTAHWDRWEGAAGAGFEALSAELRRIQAEIGITVEEGIDALGRALASGEPQILVSADDLDTLLAQGSSSSVADFLGAASVRPAGSAAESRSDTGVVLPASETENRVAALWSDLLGITPIGRTDNFFDLGGNSLLAIQLASRLRKSFDVDLPIASLFESADLASLAAAVDGALTERREAEEVGRLLEEIEALSEEQIRQELLLSTGEDPAHARREGPREQGREAAP